MNEYFLQKAEEFARYYLDNKLYLENDKLTLASGIPGFCLLLSELSEEFTTLKKHKDELVIEMVQELNKREINLSLWSGLCGVATGISNINENGNYDDILKKIEERILNSLETFFYEYDPNIANLENNSFKYYDLFTGFSGILAYLIHSKTNVFESKKAEMINNILIYFSRLTEDTIYKNNSIKNYSILPSHLTENMKSDFKDGAVIVGKAHGISGILSSLNMLPNIYNNLNVQQVKGILLADIDSYSNRSSIFPSIVNLNTTSDIEYAFNNSWCYGSLSILSSLYSGTKEKKYLDLHRRFFLLEQRNTSDYHNVDIFCHGKAGTAYLAHNYYLYSGDKLALEYRKKALLELQSSSRKKGSMNFRDNIRGKKSNGLKKGLLEGQIGVYISVLNIIKEKRFKSDWIFLIDDFN